MKKTTKKKLLIIVPSVIVVIALAAGYMIYQMMMAPMYEVGNVAKGVNLSGSLAPPKQEKLDENIWQVEADIDLKYFTQGEGRNVLVVHGGPGIPYVEGWPGLEPLGDEYKFNYYDQRGCGESTRPIKNFATTNFYENAIKAEKTLGITAQIADIERIRQILGEEELILIGHSFGGMLTSLYAAEFPQNVEALILVAPAPLLKMPMDMPGLFDSLEKELSGKDLESYNELMKEYFDFKDVFSKTDEDLTNQNLELGKYFDIAQKKNNLASPPFGMPGGWSVQSIYLSMGQKHDYTKVVSKVKVPTLIIHTGSDFVQVKEASETYLEVFPDAEFKTLDGAGHMGFYDKPNEFAKIVEDFLNK